MSARGLIEDLAPYLEADEDFKEVDFFQSVRKTNGQEYMVSKYEFGDYSGNVYWDPLTQEDKEVITELLENASMGMTYDDAIIKIVEEEAEAFYLGKKSVKEVADIIQSRVQVYVRENM